MFTQEEPQVERRAAGEPRTPEKICIDYVALQPCFISSLLMPIVLLALACREGQGGGAHLAVRYDIVAFSAGSVSALAHVRVLLHTNTFCMRPARHVLDAGLLDIVLTTRNRSFVVARRENDQARSSSVQMLFR